MINKSLNISRQFYNDLKAFINRKVSNPEDANDILQDSLLKAQKNVHLLKESSKFTSWLYQIIRNSIIDHYRIKKVAVNIDSITIENEFQLLDENDNKQLSKCIRSLIQQLPDKYRLALELSEFREMNTSELSKHLSLSISGTKSRVQRAKKRLRELILQCCEIENDNYGNIINHDCKNQDSECCKTSKA